MSTHILADIAFVLYTCEMKKKPTSDVTDTETNKRVCKMFTPS